MWPGDSVENVEYYGGGSKRSVSFTDLILRQRGITDPTNSSRLLLGAVEVKGDWQVELLDDMLLHAVFLEDSERAQTVIHALQQVGSCANSHWLPKDPLCGLCLHTCCKNYVQGHPIWFVQTCC